ncbi:MAG TPA: ABC transporter permease subunit [Clostridia bacterium]|nr:ABC transporter permease subunit [Clostridia bacterium]
MKGKQCKRFIKETMGILILVIPLVLLLIPLLGLIYSVILGQGGHDNILALILPTRRRLDLFIRSILLSLSISITSIIVASLIALSLNNMAQKYRRIANGIWRLSIFMLLLPSFLHCQGWWNTFEAIGLPTSGILAAWWVSVMFFLPLPFTLIFLSLRAMDGEVIEAAAVFLRPAAALFKIVLPSIYPAIFGAGLLVFLLSLADYSIASIFSVNVYTLDIFAQFSVSGSVSDTLLYSLPLIIAVSVVGMAGFKTLSALFLTIKGEKGSKFVPITLPNSISILSLVSLAILLLSIIVPCTNLIIGLFNSIDTTEQIVMGIEELKNTIIMSVGTIAISLPMALVIGIQLNRRKLPIIVYAILIMPLIMPSSLIGIGLIGAFNGTYLYNTVAIPILAAAIRYIPIGSILCYSGFKGLDNEVLSARLVYQRSAFNGFFKLIFPMILPFILMASLCIFILSLGEIGATIMVLPPGFNTLAIKIYNYLHYGASDVVSVLCSMLIAAVVGVTGILLFIFSLYRKGCE